MPKFLYEVTDEIYKDDGILYHITPLQNKKKILQKRLILKYKNYMLDNYLDRIYFYRRNQKSKLDLLCKNLSNDTCINEQLILKINLKDKRSYKENDKSTMYRFLKSQTHSMTYLHMKIQIHNVQKFTKKLYYKNKKVRFFISSKNLTFLFMLDKNTCQTMLQYQRDVRH